MKHPRSWITRGTLAGRVFFVLTGNVFLFILTLFFFEGGAFPWGEIRPDGFFVVAAHGTFKVQAWWFWTSFWHGLFTSASIALLFVGVGVYELFKSYQLRQRQDLLTNAMIAVMGASLLGFVIFTALQIASGQSAQ